MSDVGKTEAKAPVAETVVETTPAVVETNVEKTEEPETETTEVETTETPVEGAEVVETEEEKKTTSKIKREKQKAREAALVAENKRLTELVAAADRTKPASDELGPKPDRSKYEDEAEYQADLAAHRIEERLIARQAKAHENTTSTLRNDSIAAKNELFFERARALEDRFPGIEKVIRSDDVPISPVMRDVLVESEKGPEVTFYLAANREVAKSIFDLSKINPLAAARELGRIEATIALPKPRTETKAPPPPSTLSGTVKGPAKNPENMTQAEYVAWRNNGGGEKRTG